MKQIAKTKVWPNNQMVGGPMQEAAAKTILARHSRSVSFEEASTIDIVRRMAPFRSCSDGVDGMTKFMASMSMPPAQPVRPKLSQPGSHCNFDQRRLCDASLCTNVEHGVNKFQKCGRCRQVAYCRKECQIAHWKAHKNQCSPAT